MTVNYIKNFTVFTQKAMEMVAASFFHRSE